MYPLHTYTLPTFEQWFTILRLTERLGRRDSWPATDNDPLSRETRLGINQLLTACITLQHALELFERCQDQQATLRTAISNFAAIWAISVEYGESQDLPTNRHLPELLWHLSALRAVLRECASLSTGHSFNNEDEDKDEVINDQ